MKKLIFAFVALALLAAISCKQATKPVATEPVKITLSAPSEKMIAAKVYIKAGHEEEFIKEAQWIIENTRKEEGNLEYTLYQDPVNKSNFLFFERYKNQAAIDAHFAATYFKEFGTKIAGITSQASEIKIYDITETK
jgi:quinol monooxygenase YgiN